MSQKPFPPQNRPNAAPTATTVALTSLFGWASALLRTAMMVATAVLLAGTVSLLLTLF